MKDLDLTTLRLFVAVCDSRSIVRVAERENIVPSAISKRLAQLEVDVGCQLLQRIRRGVEPTAAGETLREHARGLLGSAQRITDDMRAYTAGAAGLVRLVATTSSVAESLPEDIAEFLKSPVHHAIRVNVQEQLSRDVVRAVREGSVSLGVCWDAADLSGLQTYPYRQDHLAIVTPAGHALAGRRDMAFAESLEFDQVTLPAASAVCLMLVRAAANTGQSLHYRAEVSTFEAALRVVRSGLGISVVPREVALPLAAAFDLHVIPLTDAWARRRFVICFQDEGALSPAAKLLAAHLTQASSRATRFI
ncbi:MAG: transcriptional regulator, LysR family [Polaromonas sp.]|nr:transcriptional regulator, LysR family [Polaromonas sp.]